MRKRLFAHLDKLLLEFFSMPLWCRLGLLHSGSIVEGVFRCNHCPHTEKLHRLVALKNDVD